MDGTAVWCCNVTRKTDCKSVSGRSCVARLNRVVYFLSFDVHSERGAVVGLMCCLLEWDCIITRSSTVIEAPRMKSRETAGRAAHFSKVFCLTCAQACGRRKLYGKVASRAPEMNLSGYGTHIAARPVGSSITSSSTLRVLQNNKTGCLIPTQAIFECGSCMQGDHRSQRRGRVLQKRENVNEIVASRA